MSLKNIIKTIDTTNSMLRTIYLDTNPANYPNSFLIDEALEKIRESIWNLAKASNLLTQADKH